MKSSFGSAIVKAIQTFVLCVSFTALAFAQIAGLSDTGQPPATALGGTEVLVPSAPSTSGTPHLDGNWKVGLTINGQLASDNATYGLYLESPAGSPPIAQLWQDKIFPSTPRLATLNSSNGGPLASRIRVRLRQGLMPICMSSCRKAPLSMEDPRPDCVLSSFPLRRSSTRASLLG